MRTKSTAVVAVAAVAAFVCGALFGQPGPALRGQAKDEKPAPTAVGRYQALVLHGGNLAVIDTASGHVWQYIPRHREPPPSRLPVPVEPGAREVPAQWAELGGPTTQRKR
jgi:hypothetical protein